MIFIYLLSFICLLFGIIVILREIYQINRIRKICIINVFGITYGMMYGLVTSIYLTWYCLFDYKFSRIKYDDVSLRSLWIWISFAIIGYIGISIVYSLSMRNKECFPKLNNELFQDQSQLFRLQITSIVCLVIGFVSLFLWSYAFGGIFELIKVANAVRSGRYSGFNKLAFFKHPTRIVTMVSFISLKLIKEKYKVFLNVSIFTVSLVLSILYLFASDGRLTLGLYIIILLFMSTDIFKKDLRLSKKIFGISFFLIIAVIIMMNMDVLSYYIKNGVWVKNESSGEGFISRLFDEFTFIPASGQIATMQLLKGDTPYLVVNDILSGLFAWVPSSMKPNNLINVWDYNTYLYNNGAIVIGQMPCDYITTSIYDLGILGIFAFSIFWGIVIQKVDFKHVYKNTVFYDITYYPLAMVFFRVVSYCQMYDFALEMFYIFVAFVVWKLSVIFVKQ